MLQHTLYIVTMSEPYVTAFARYLPTEPDALQWGLYVVDCGHRSIPPGCAYPPCQKDAPADYRMSWQEGRTLQEYQVVYISEGRGVFESELTGRKTVHEGHVIILFPGVWHRFRPIKTLGWDESWLGFKGETADRIMQAFFTPQQAVIQVGQAVEILNLMRSVSGLTDHTPAGYAQIAAARTTEVLALIRSRAITTQSVDRNAANKVQQARQYLAKSYGDPVDVPALAKTLGLSYSRFRTLFKEHTGMAPNQYHTEMRLNLAQHWLVDSNLSVTEIAYKLGFSSVYYFSRLFKKKVGCPPGAFRKR